ncbi:hypothetical protein CEXT_641531 [Caerostris extrusa]|uniref:Uncharacterized protein n=1 Tax=Caerostris extrusa TaxID=172846 RepID=A0AAV4TDK6_CAEEX|nr:hypothetical protein CEXT_641531 [Caerostris extrusa]
MCGACFDTIQQMSANTQLNASNVSFYTLKAKVTDIDSRGNAWRVASESSDYNPKSNYAPKKVYGCNRILAGSCGLHIFSCSSDREEGCRAHPLHVIGHLPTMFFRWVAQPTGNTRRGCSKNGKAKQGKPGTSRKAFLQYPLVPDTQRKPAGPPWSETARPRQRQLSSALSHLHIRG